jgi:hypothetical protein
MEIQEKDINNIKGLLGYIKQLSDDGLSPEYVGEVVKLLEYIKPFFRHLILSASFPEITRLTINRKVIKKNERLLNIRHIKYPPSDLVEKFGRCNQPYQSILYAGFIKPTIISELKPEIGDLITTSVWKEKKDRQMFFCPIFLNQPTDGTFNPRSFEMNQKFERTIKDFSENEKTLIRYISQFVADEFSKEIYSDNDYEYFLSAYFSSVIFNEINNGKVDAIYYPSVQEKLSDENIAIKPNVFDENYELVEVSDAVVVSKSGRLQYFMQGIGSTSKFDLGNDLILWGENNTDRIENLKNKYDFKI